MTGQEVVKHIKAENRNKMQLTKFRNVPDYRKQQLGIDDKFIEDYVKNVNEEDFMDLYFQELTNKFIMCLPKEVQDKLSNIVVGVVPSFTINASAIVNTECDDNVIILHAQLLAIISQFCELQMLIGKNINIKEIKKEAYIQLKEIVNCYLYPNYALKVNILNSDLDSADFQLISCQTTIIEMFIIAHELAHVYLGHCQRAGNKTVYLNSNKIHIYEHMQFLELEADKQAFQWLVKVLRNENYHEAISFYREHEMFATEIFQLLHLLDVSTGRLDDISRVAREINKEDEIVCRGILILRELEDILLKKENGKYSHPSALIRLANLIYNQNNEETMRNYMMDSFWNGLFFESYDVRDVGV